MKWIAVEDRLPEEANLKMKPYGLGWLVFNGHEVKTSYMHPTNWNTEDNWGIMETATHWMPLPEPPLSEGEK